MTIWLIVALVFHVMGFFSSISAIMTARTSQGSIAWAISLNTFPYVAVPAYWILGRSRFEGYITARKYADTDAAMNRNFTKVMEQFAPYRIDETNRTPVMRGTEALADIPFLCGNELELLIDGDATFDSIVAGIDVAKKYILFQFFIVKDDGLGQRIKKHLLARAAQGVKIYFTYDEIGSGSLPESYKKELRDAGVEVHEFNTRKGRRNRFQLNFRNHRKLVVVDGKTAWIGGHNVGDEYLGKDPKFGHWRDTHIKITGPSVLAAQLSFVEDWNWATNKKIENLDWSPTLVEKNDKQVLIIPSGPADEYETASLMFLHAINSAKKRIWISSPYFVPDDAIVSALQLAGLRGVDVRILIPDMPDHLAVYLAAFSYFDEASLTGAEIHRYTDGFLHAKMMLVDDAISTIGTANFDNRSFRLNFEITAVVHNEEFASKVEKMFITDFSNSRKMTKADIDEKSFWFKLGVRLARLTSPIQ